MGKARLTITIDKEIIKEMEEVRDALGIPVSSQVEMKIKGYSIVKNELLKEHGIDPFNIIWK